MFLWHYTVVVALLLLLLVSKKQAFSVASEIVKHGAIPDAFYLTSSLSALNHNHILSTATTASAISEAAACKLFLACDTEEHGSCAQAGHMWGISPVMGLTPSKPGAGSEQHDAGGDWKLVPHRRRSDITVMSAKLLCSYWSSHHAQHTATCSHVVPPTMFFFFTNSHGVKILNSIGFSLGRSSARGPFALQAGTWRPRASTAWRWGLPFIWRLRANCYSIVPVRQRCILCSFSAVAAFARNIWGNKFVPSLTAGGLKTEFHTGNIVDENYDKWYTLISSGTELI